MLALHRQSKGEHMTRTCGRVIGIAALACLLVASLGAGMANADPAGAKGALFVALDCGSGPVSTVTNGNGVFTSTKERDGTGVFVPTLFGAVRGVVTDPEGNEFPFEDSALLPKGSANPKGHEILDCTFVVDQDTPDGGHLFVEGAVSGFWTH
jgi:hypothetical protein